MAGVGCGEGMWLRKSAPKTLSVSEDFSDGGVPCQLRKQETIQSLRDGVLVNKKMSTLSNK